MLLENFQIPIKHCSNRGSIDITNTYVTAHSPVGVQTL